MRRLAEEEQVLFAERSEELAYLVNVMVAGCSFQQRRLRPIEAIRAAIAVCSLGIELAVRDAGRPAVDPVETAAAFLRDHSLDGLFRLAWAKLDRDLVEEAADVALTLLQAASAAEGADSRIVAQALAHLSLAKDKGEPWTSIAEFEAAIGGVGGPGVVEALGALMDELPSFPAALVLGSGGQHNPEGPRFVATIADLLQLRKLLARYKADLFAARPRGPLDRSDRGRRTY
jgi:hypothetical protein